MISLDSEWQTNEFMLYCRTSQLREKSMMAYEQSLKLFGRWCAEEMGIFTVDKVSENVIRRYIIELQERGKNTFYAIDKQKKTNYPERQRDYRQPVSTATINNYIRNIRVFFNWLERNYIIKKNPMKNIRQLRTNRQPKVYLTDEELRKLLANLDLSTNDRYSAGFSSNRAANGFTATVDQAIANFQADAAKLNKDRPLLIVSHQPLLDNRNDNGYAYHWCTAINAVAEEMDVAFFFGHNHKYDKSSDYYYAKGSTMSVCSDSSGNAKSVKLNFAHICGGYMEPTSTGSYSSSGTTSVSFTSSKIKVGSYYLRYSSGKISLNRTATTANLFKETVK